METSCVRSTGHYLVKIERSETTLRERIKDAGGRWQARDDLWLVTGQSPS